MLGSITPLGERARRSRWGITVVTYVVGSTVGGLAVGAGLGALGAALAPSRPVALGTLAVLIGAGIVFDLGPRGLALPTVHRQVNEAWLHRYRGWVYGSGFGLQLGAGVVTVVVSSAVYCALAAAFLSSSPMGGAFVGVTFGMLRAITVLPASRALRPGQLGRIDARLRAWEGPSRRVALIGELMVIGVCVAGALG